MTPTPPTNAMEEFQYKVQEQMLKGAGYTAEDVEVMSRAAAALVVRELEDIKRKTSSIGAESERHSVDPLRDDKFISRKRALGYIEAALAPYKAIVGHGDTMVEEK